MQHISFIDLDVYESWGFEVFYIFFSLEICIFIPIMNEVEKPW